MSHYKSDNGYDLFFNSENIKKDLRVGINSIYDSSSCRSKR